MARKSGDINNNYLTGQDDDDFLFGLGGNDTLKGNAGNDYLHGGSGIDTMIGGEGNDTYDVDNTSDIVTESFSQGTDTIYSSVTFTTSSDVENLNLTGSGDIDATGNSLDNILIGNSGANTLSGGEGNDILCASGGNDVDGTWGDWTLQEGETDIFMLNNRTGKKFKINMTEVD